MLVFVCSWSPFVSGIAARLDCPVTDEFILAPSGAPAELVRGGMVVGGCMEEVSDDMVP